MSITNIGIQRLDHKFEVVFEIYAQDDRKLLVVFVDGQQRRRNNKNVKTSLPTVFLQKTILIFFIKFSRFCEI